MKTIKNKLIILGLFLLMVTGLSSCMMYPGGPYYGGGYGYGPTYYGGGFYRPYYGRPWGYGGGGFYRGGYGGGCGGYHRGWR